MRVLIDTNIILDFLLAREPFASDAEMLFQLICAGQISGFVSATTLTDIFYIARRHTQSLEKAKQSVELIMSSMEICPVDRAVLELALSIATPDFEDAIQIACAVQQRLDAIVTRDADLTTDQILVLSIQQVFQQRRI